MKVSFIFIDKINFNYIGQVEKSTFLYSLWINFLWNLAFYYSWRTEFSFSREIVIWRFVQEINIRIYISTSINAILNYSNLHSDFSKWVPTLVTNQNALFCPYLISSTCLSLSINFAFLHFGNHLSRFSRESKEDEIEFNQQFK